MRKKEAKSCFLYSGEEVQEILRKCHSIEEAKSKIKERFIKINHVVDAANEKIFLEEYHECSVEDWTVWETGAKSQRRKDYCKRCPNIDCEDCQEKDRFRSNDSCHACLKSREGWDCGVKDTFGDKCFFCSEFQKVIHIEIQIDEWLFAAGVDCDYCGRCEAVAVGTEEVLLHDITLNGYPTEVVVNRPVYRRFAYGRKCNKVMLPGIQKQANSRMTCRLVRACKTAALRGGGFPELAEWYGIKITYLNKMRSEQVGALARRKAELRKKVDAAAGLAESFSAVVQDQSCKLWFRAPDVWEAAYESLELIGIYKDEELYYLQNKLIDDYTCRWRPDISCDMVFSMAFDYAMTEESVAAPPMVFALVMAMADSFNCFPIKGNFYAYRLLHLRMVEILMKDGSLRELLELAESAQELMPNEMQEHGYFDYAGLLVDDLRERWLKRKNNWVRISHYRKRYLPLEKDLRSAAEETVINISRRTNREQVPFDELREKLLFFNQAVVPYERKENELSAAPAFLKNGDLDVSKINSVGIRCTCLNCLINSGLLECDSDRPIQCKERYLLNLMEQQRYGDRYTGCDGKCQELEVYPENDQEGF